jgi:hypothetical protein
MTPEEKERIIQLLEAGQQETSIEEIVRSIAREMSHLTTVEVAEVCQVHAETRHLDASVQFASAQASKRIAEIENRTA